MTAEEYAEAMADICHRLADSSEAFAADMAEIWWRNLPVALPSGLDMTGTAAVLAARLAKLGPDGDPLEQLMMGSMAYLQGVQDQMRAHARGYEQAGAAIDQDLSGTDE